MGKSRAKKSSAAELGREVVVVSATTDRMRDYPATGLTPGKLAALLRLADQGYIRAQQELFDDIEERWGHLFAVLQTRKLAVAGLPLEVVPAVEGDAKAEEAARLVREALGRIRNLRQGLLDLLDGIGKGFSVVEPIWTYEDGRWWVERLEYRSQRMFTFHGDGELRLLTDRAPVDGEEVPLDRLIVHQYRARSGRPERTALLRVCFVPYLFATYGLKDWLTFCEVYGHPYIVARYEPGTPEAEKAVLRQAARLLASDSSLTISKSAEIDIKNAIDKSATSELYRSLVRDMENTASKIVLGQTQTTQIDRDAGSQASAGVHDEVRQDIKEGDALALGETLTDGLARPLCAYNLGPEHPVPSVRLRADRRLDRLTEARVLEVLAGRLRLPVAKKHVYGTFGVPEPQPEDELLEVPADAGEAPVVAARRPAGDAVVLSVRPPGGTGKVPRWAR